MIVELDTPSHNLALGRTFPGEWTSYFGECWIFFFCFKRRLNLITGNHLSILRTIGIMAKCNSHETFEEDERNADHFETSNILNPTLSETYLILKEILNEFRALFPSNHIHLGK